LFNWLLTSMHIFGFSQLVARFFNRHLGLSYAEFYDGLRASLMKDDWFRNEQDEIRRHYAKWMTDGHINHPKIAGIDIHGWNLGLRTVLTIHAENRHDMVFEHVATFARSHPDADQALLDDVLELQKLYAVRFERRDQYPLNVRVGSNIHDYITGADALVPVETQYALDFPEDRNVTLKTYLERFYFSRRRNYGKVSITRVNQAPDSGLPSVVPDAKSRRIKEAVRAE